MSARHSLTAFLTDLRTAMVGNTALSALAGARMYLASAPQGAGYPRIIWHVITDVQDVTHDSGTATQPAADVTVQFEIEALSQDAVHAMRDALASLWTGYRGSGTLTCIDSAFPAAGSDYRESYNAGDGTAEVFRLTKDFEFSWREK